VPYPTYPRAGGLELRADSFFPTLPLLSALFTRASAAEAGAAPARAARAAAAAASPGPFRWPASSWTSEPGPPAAREPSWSTDGGDLPAPLEPFDEREEPGAEARAHVPRNPPACSSQGRPAACRPDGPQVQAAVTGGGGVGPDLPACHAPSAPVRHSAEQCVPRRAARAAPSACGAGSACVRRRGGVVAGTPGPRLGQSGTVTALLAAQVGMFASLFSGRGHRGHDGVRRGAAKRPFAFPLTRWSRQGARAPGACAARVARRTSRASIAMLITLRTWLMCMHLRASQQPFRCQAWTDVLREVGHRKARNRAGRLSLRGTEPQSEL